MIDIQEKKKKIIAFLETEGPSLPVQVARTIQMDPVFASAILSELLGTKTIKISHMRIGSSPLYLLPGQEEKLEEKTEHLKSIEKEAQEKLKHKTIIIDKDEEPAIRVALRNIKDFATPFKFQNKIKWKYTFASQEEIDKILFPKKEIPSSISKPKPKISKTEKTKQFQEQDEEELKKVENIFEKPKEEPQKKATQSPKTFLEEIEHFLKTQNTSITTIEEVDKKKVTAIVKSENSSSMIFAFNKTKIDETELIKCYKTADKKNLPYQIIIRGDLTKKLTDTIRAHQKLIKVNKLEK